MSNANDAILGALRDELVRNGVITPAIRKASKAGAGYPVHVEPVEGAPAPGEREAPEDNANLVITLLNDGELAEDVFDAYRRRTIINVHYRSKTTAGKRAAAQVDDAIRGYLTSRGAYGQGWVMGTGTTVYVLSVNVFGGFGPVARSKATGYTDAAKYAIETLA